MSVEVHISRAVSGTLLQIEQQTPEQLQQLVADGEVARELLQMASLTFLHRRLALVWSVMQQQPQLFGLNAESLDIFKAEDEGQLRHLRVYLLQDVQTQDAPSHACCTTEARNGEHGVLMRIYFLQSDEPCFTRTAIDHELTHCLRCLIYQANLREAQRQAALQGSLPDLQNTPTRRPLNVGICLWTHDRRCQPTITQALRDAGLWGRMACDVNTREYDSGFIMEQAWHNGIMCMFKPAARGRFVEGASTAEVDISLALVQRMGPSPLNDGTMDYIGFLVSDTSREPRLLIWNAPDSSRRTRSNQRRCHSYSTRN